MNTNSPVQIAQHKLYNFGIFLDYGEIKNEDVDVIVGQTDMHLSVLGLERNECWDSCTIR